MIKSAFVLACALTACKSSDAPKADPPKTEPVPTEAQAPAPPPAPAPTPAAAGDLPGPCAEYKGLIERLAECQKLPPATRAGLRKAFEQSWAGWERAADRAAIDRECKAAADNLRTAAAGACSW